MNDINGSITLGKLVNLDLNTKTLTGSVTINTTETGTIALTGAGTITGDLNITAQNATVINNNNITGATNVDAVSYNSFKSSATHTGAITILKGRLELTNNASAAQVKINGTDKVILAGTLNNVAVEKENAVVEVENEASITNLAINQDATIITSQSLQATVAGGVTVTVKAGENETGKTIPATETGGEVELNPTPEAPETKYGVTVANVVGGTATVTTNVIENKATEGDTVTVSITDIESGKQFKSITVTDAENGNIEITTVTAGESYTFIMPAKAVTITVEVESIPVTTYEVTFSSGENGTLVAVVDSETINTGTEVEEGKTVVFTATPANGYKVKGWAIDGVDVPDNTTNTLTIESLDAAKAVVVEFEKIPQIKYTLTLIGEGLTSTPEAGAIEEGTEVTVTVAPTEGQKVATFTVGGEDKKSELKDGKYTFNIAADTEVAVTYEDIQVPVVEPKIELDQAKVDVVTETAIENTSGQITGAFNTEGRTPINVTLIKGTEDYANVRVLVEGGNDGIQLLALDVDGGNVWYDIVQTGWGTSGGFPIADAITPVYVVANQAGTYNITIKLINVNDNAVLASATGTVIATSAKEVAITKAESEINNSSFVFTATDNIGSGNQVDPAWGAFAYSTDGAFYMLQLRKDDVLVPFASVFEGFKLQTDAKGSVEQTVGNWHDYTTGLRNTSDFTTDRTEHKGTAFLITPLENTEFDGALFYGIHSDIYGVNITAGDVRTINFDTKIKAGVESGNYTLTIALYSPVRKDGGQEKYTANELQALSPLKDKTWSFNIPAN